MKNAIKNWFSEQYVRVTAEQAYEQEKEYAIATLEKERNDLETALASYTIHTLTIDYDGITTLSFEGNIAFLATKGEHYTVRLHKDEDMFAFVKNLGFKNTTHTISGRDKWVITTPMAPSVSKYSLPKVDILTFREKEAIITLDLSKDIDVPFIRGLVNAIHGEFSVALNYKRIELKLAQLVRELNAIHSFDFQIYVDAVNVHKFTFYVKSRDEITYDLSHLGQFNVEKLLFGYKEFADNLTNQFLDELPKVNDQIIAERKRKERTRLMKQAREKIEQLDLKHISVECLIDESESPFQFRSLNEKIFIRLDAEEKYFVALSFLDELKEQWKNQSEGTQFFLNHMTFVETSLQPFSVKEKTIYLFMTEDQIPALFKEIEEKGLVTLKEAIEERFQYEQPAVRKVLERLEFDTIQRNGNPLVSGKISYFMDEEKYKWLVEFIGEIWIEIAQFEHATRYQPFRWGFNRALFDIDILEETIPSLLDNILVVTIKKENHEPYKKYFKNQVLLTSKELKEWKIITG